ncbi:hypothetical protein ElyMa_005487300 [Elysia marginata]|uniref:Uncharacterized protein n=1 Tax=Elysia marginata TaxID=1093978 RepID=A0AAV4ESJ9_9GAST|nr:hypothetical protein ElyMa_005487300 [Elysia marginata]
MNNASHEGSQLCTTIKNEVQRFGGAEVRRFGGAEVQRFGGAEVQRFGGDEVWRALLKIFTAYHSVNEKPLLTSLATSAACAEIRAQRNVTVRRDATVYTARRMTRGMPAGDTIYTRQMSGLVGQTTYQVGHV